MMNKGVRKEPRTEPIAGFGNDLPIGAMHYRAYVGPPEKYDLVAAMQFNLLTTLGLREHHSLLDIGCGSLRAGRLFIPFLLPGKYFGLEPNKWLIEQGVASEIGNDLVRIKRPVFDYNCEFDLAVFAIRFSSGTIDLLPRRASPDPKMSKRGSSGHAFRVDVSRNLHSRRGKL